MRLLYILVSISVLSSCSKKVLFQEAYLLESSRVDRDKLAELNTYYAGDAFDYITFQVDINNRSENTIFLSERDVELRFRREGRRAAVINPIRKNEMIQNLVLQDESLEAQKKASTVGRSVLSGVTILSSVLSGGDPLINVVSGTDIALDIVEERRQYEAAQGTIEEQIAYLEEYALGERTIAPGETGSFDIHFERLMVDGLAKLIIYSGTDKYISEYELVVVKKRL